MKKLLAVLVLALVLAACGGASYTAGTYSQTVKGHNGDMTVEVVVSESKIESVTIVSHVESAGISDAALERVPAAIVEKQSTEVDTVSGATVSSNAIISAVTAALAEATK